MPSPLDTVPDLRAGLTSAGWQLTEMAGGPWIIYGHNGDAELCVMAKGRLLAWERASNAAAVSPRLPAPRKTSA